MQSLRRNCWRRWLPSKPAPRSQTLAQRTFSHKQSCSLSRIPQRSQLPYLHTRQGGAPQFQQPQVRFFRLFTIREPTNLREFGKTFLQVVIVCEIGYGLWKVAQWGMLQEIVERSHPTPAEYSWFTRIPLREALSAEEAGTKGATLPDWKDIGDKFSQVLRRLEDRSIDGKAVRGQLGEDEEIFVAGVGRTGSDVSSCSEPWRRGYYQALMGAGRCAERLDGWVYDRSRDFIAPEAYVTSPSNPTPKAMPSTANGAASPREEDCEPAFDPPQKFYLRVITTRGFSVGQRLRAALAYADWLRYKGLNEAAQGMHTWAVDIALEGIDGDAQTFVDNQTGILHSKTTTLTPNLLLATESFGTHFALTGDMAAALPVFLSVLRTQQNLPAPSQAVSSARKPLGNPLWENIFGFLRPPKYPEPPPSGDDLLTHTADAVCASTRSMAHIGEVLFASDLSALSPGPVQSAQSPAVTPIAHSSHDRSHPTRSQSAGLAWTRQAADVAEATLRALDPVDETGSNVGRGTSKQQDEREHLQEQQKRCAACLSLALDNWMKMVERFERAELQRKYPSPKVEQTVDRGAQKRNEQNVRNMMATAYSKDAKPEEVLARAEEMSKAVEVEEIRGSMRPTSTPKSSGGGWGMFWSSKLGLTPEPEETRVSNEDGQGPWAAEAATVRARRYEARLLRRQLGLDE